MTDGSAVVGDREALVALYESAGGSNWTDNSNWLSSHGLDEWFGVAMDETGRVEFLDLADNQLAGSIPPELGNLTNLAGLDLSWNRLTGSIPPQIGKLTNLRELHLSQNNLMGSIPSELGYLTTLRELSLSQNELTGTIPPEFGNLRNLESLSLFENRLTGSIPAVFVNLTNLKELSLSQNKLTGRIPPALVEQLRRVRTAKAQPRFPVPDLPPRKTTAPAELADDAALLKEAVSRTAGAALRKALLETGEGTLGHFLSNEALSEIARKAARDALYEASGAPDREELAVSSRLFKSLDRKTLSDTIETAFGEVLYEFAEQPDRAVRKALSALVEKGVFETLAEIPETADREVLVALYNSARGPTWKANSNWVRSIGLHWWFGVTVNEAGRVERLILPDNQLTGSIPPEIGNLTHLKQLDLSENRLVGGIPPEIGNLTNLTHLDLGGNQLTGSIPSEIGNLKQLTGLHLGNNKITGTIPPELASLTKVRRLGLEWNELTGRIPPEMGRLTNLTWLALHENRLTGSIPLEFINFGTILEPSLHGNQFTGRIWPVFGGRQQNTKARKVIIRVGAMDGKDGALPPENGGATSIWIYQPAKLRALREAAGVAFDAAKQEAFSGNVVLMIRIHLRDEKNRRDTVGPGELDKFVAGIREGLAPAQDELLCNQEPRMALEAQGLQPSKAIAFKDQKQVVQTVLERLDGDSDWYEVVVAEATAE